MKQLQLLYVIFLAILIPASLTEVIPDGISVKNRVKGHPVGSHQEVSRRVLSVPTKGANKQYMAKGIPLNTKTADRHRVRRTLEITTKRIKCFSVVMPYCHVFFNFVSFRNRRKKLCTTMKVKRCYAIDKL